MFTADTDLQLLSGAPSSFYTHFHELANTFHGPVRAVTKRGDPGWAVHLLTQAVRNKPEDPYPWKRGAKLFHELGMLDRASLWSERARALGPSPTTQITE